MTGHQWEHFPHGADVGVRGFGATEAEAFAHVAEALTAIVADPSSIAPLDAVSFELSGADHEVLLVDWLNALIFEMAVRRMLFGRFEVHVDGDRLRATAWGEPVDVARHQPAIEVKGATYTSLAVGRVEDGTWRAQCVVDV